MGVWVHDRIEVGAKLPGVDPRRLRRSIRDGSSWHETAAPDRSQFAYRGAIPTDYYRPSGFHLAEDGPGVIAQFSLCDDAVFHGG